MSQLTHVFVTVPEGREVPINKNEATAAGGMLLRCVQGDPKSPNVYKLPWTESTRRRVNAGDLVLSNQSGTRVDTGERARAAATVKVDADGIVSRDQRSDEDINKAEAVKAAAAEAAAKAKADQAKGS